MSLLSYENFALQYDRGSATNPFNTLLERPALLGLLGPPGGLRVLEAGCAGGRLTRALADEGARVVAVDASPTLVELARQRVGPAAEFRLHDLRRPLEFQPDGSVDAVVSSLTMHYLADWGPALGEFRRVLAPGGRVLISTHHPVTDTDRTAPDADYHIVEEITEVWNSYGSPPMTVRYYRRPLESIMRDARRAGLVLSDLREPRPAEDQQAAFGRKFARVTARPPFIVLEFVPAPDGATSGPRPEETT
ncbi:methyltransferase domain-containing protein [Streptomyces sp. NPDC101455]|uniref:class I SAM-dependent methyltransferase n=1 Tax=Streptomyces sp. NPDC101455 TaxID=3366142 RepID=UPI00382FF3A0